jgi:hypothetical protein
MKPIKTRQKKLNYQIHSKSPKDSKIFGSFICAFSST